MKTRTQKTHAWGLPSPVDPDLFDEIRVSVFLPDTLIGDLLPYVTHFNMDRHDEPPGTIWERFRYGFETGNQQDPARTDGHNYQANL